MLVKDDWIVGTQYTNKFCLHTESEKYTVIVISHKRPNQQIDQLPIYHTLIGKADNTREAYEIMQAKGKNPIGPHTWGKDIYLNIHHCTPEFNLFPTKSLKHTYTSLLDPQNVTSKELVYQSAIVDLRHLLCDL